MILKELKQKYEQETKRISAWLKGKTTEATWEAAIETTACCLAAVAMSH